METLSVLEDLIKKHNELKEAWYAAWIKEQRRIMEERLKRSKAGLTTPEEIGKI